MKKKIEKKMKRKTNPKLVRTIILAKKNPAWIEVANVLSNPKRKKTSLNLDEINAQANDGETIVVPGSVLGRGKVEKKIKVVGLKFSDTAKEKLEKENVKTEGIYEEIEKNKEGKNIKVLKNGK